MSDRATDELLADLRRGLPPYLADADLAGEADALRAGLPASLPFLRDGSAQVDWVTAAPDHSGLLTALDVLRAWIFPGLGGDEPGRTFAPPRQTGPLAELAPAGYLRWRSPADARTVREILVRLSRARRLATSRPASAGGRVPTLLDLRGRFAAALAAGDRPSAEEAVALADRHQLDTARNTLFSRVRMWDRFGDADEIKDAVRAHGLLSMRLPRLVEEGIRRALPEMFASEELPTPPPPAAVTPVAPARPRDWPTFLRAFPEAARRVGAFLDDHDPLDLAALTDDARGELYEALEECASRPAAAWPTEAVAPYMEALATLVGECLDNGEAAGRDVPILALLADEWAARKAGSSYPPDGRLLLGLCEELLRLRPDDEAASDLVHRWATGRPLPGQLPFLLSAGAVLLDAGSTEHVIRLWAVAGPHAVARKAEMTPGERAGWRAIAEAAGDAFDDIPETEAAAADPLAAAGLRSIAVVSLREEPAKQAATALAARTGASVRVVTATHGNFETSALENADVIAYVWAASTHAVFRAMSKSARRRVAYVRGTGAAQIVVAVERWAAERLGG